MGQQVTKAELARMLGITKGAISHAVGSGRIRCDSGGRVWLDDPTNASYVDEVRARVATRPARPDAAPSHQQDAGPVMDVDEEIAVAQRTKRADMEIREHKSEKTYIEKEKLKKSVIPMEICDRAIGEAGTQCQQYLMGLPDQIGDELFALAQAGDREAFDRCFLSGADDAYKNIANGVERIIGDVKRDE